MLLINETLEKFNYNPSNLTNMSSKPILLKCDYCCKIYEGTQKRRTSGNKIVNKDSCWDCRFKKREEVSLARDGVKNSAQRKEVKKKISTSNSDRLKSQEYKDLVKKTNLEKYGCEFSMQADVVKEKHKQTVLNRYGVDNISKIDGNHKKVSKTIEEKYGAKSYIESEVGKNRILKTMNEKYGVDNAFQSEEIKDKIKETNIQKYGYDHYLKNPVNAERVSNLSLTTKIKNGTVRTFQEKTIKEWAEENGFSRSRFHVLVEEYGFEVAITMTPHESSLETFFKTILDKIGVEYKQQFYVSSKKADFFLPKHNIICECDSLYWHSESEQTNNNYHVEKRQLYIDNKYFPLFFREEEINKKTEIVQSVILNKIGQNNKIHARKCSTSFSKTDDIGFFGSNHLMGKGSGNCFWLYHNAEPVSCMSIKCTNIINGEYEISRFCNKLNTSVVGGFSKLLSLAKKTLKNMKSLITFIDLRYGSGEYLDQFGFVKEPKAYPSFRWTNGSVSYHRMKFSGNSGYDKGFTKIWDCGQQKYILNI